MRQKYNTTAMLVPLILLITTIGLRAAEIPTFKAKTRSVAAFRNEMGVHRQGW